MNNEQDTFLSQNVSDFPLNQYRFLWFLFAADALYPIFAAIERSMLGSYPPKRFYQTKLMTSVIWVHIVCGSTILITGMVNLAVGEVDADSGPNWYYYLAGICSLAHCFTGLFMLPTVHGQKTITQPLYFVQLTMNAFDAVTLLRHPSFDHLMFLWGAINAFILVRMLFFSLALFPWMDKSMLYTYAVAGSFISPVLTGHDAMWLCAYGLPVLYVPFVHWFGYRQERKTAPPGCVDTPSAPCSSDRLGSWRRLTAKIAFPKNMDFSTSTVSPLKLEAGPLTERDESSSNSGSSSSSSCNGVSFFRTKDDIVRNRTGVLTCFFGGILMAAIVALLQTQSIQNDTAGEQCNNLAG
eukprot:m.270683 g.270683  ORF g.270683 m.270683 type:complete len:353 (+) comp11083_c2_seq1:509-1567(+)